MHVESLGSMAPLDLNSIPFPPALPQPFEQWLPLNLLTLRREAPKKVSGWLIHIPGFVEPEFYRSWERAMDRHAYLTSLLRSRSYLVIYGGDLIDTRGGQPKLLRAGYQMIFRNYRRPRELAATLRALRVVANSKSFYLTTEDDGVLCQSCVRQNWWHVAHAFNHIDDPEWQVRDLDVHVDSRVEGVITCYHCNEEIPPVHQ